MPLTSGTRVGSYEIIAPLGAGGMGEVYLARDLKLERFVALKILPPDFASDPQRMRRFIREAKAASALNHPNILTIYEILEADSTPVIATEHIQGETLRQRLAGSKMTVQESLEVAIQVTSALAAAHVAGVVHRDIKPENIMLRPDGFVKILDFGLAKVMGSAGEENPGEERTLSVANTEPGMILGTARYMSPEQARGGVVDARTDLWSLGVVLYEMIAGVNPFDGAASTEILAFVLLKEPPPLGQLASGIPEALERIVTKALVKNPAERYQTAQDLLLDLRRLKTRLTTHAKLERSAETRRSVETSSSKSAAGEGKDSETPVAGGIVEGEASAEEAGRRFSALRKLHRSKTLIALLLLLGAAAASYLYYTRRALASIDSIAVLPFVNVGGDSEMEYFSDGMTESTIHSLSQLPQLSVIARSSVFRYKGQEMDPQAVGKKLGVQAVLTGRITRWGDHLTLSVELVDVHNNRHLWGMQYHRNFSEVLSMQSEISGEICQMLRWSLTREQQQRATRRYTENTTAYHLYLKGRFYWNKRTGEDVKKSIDYFLQAIAADPSYALAYAGLADAYIALPVYTEAPLQEALKKARSAASKALERDDTLAEAHTSMAGSIGAEDWYFKGAESEFKRAIELNPNYATARQWYAQFLSTMGRHAEAIEQIKQAQELDPLSLIIQANVGNTLIKARQYDHAIEQLVKTLEMDKNFYRAHVYLGNAFVEKGMYERALEEFQQAAVLSGSESLEKAAARTTELKRALTASGARGYWKKQLAWLEEEAKQKPVSPYRLAGLYARLGQKDAVIEWLHKAFQERDINFLNLKIDPEFDAFRFDPQVVAIVQQVNLPEWSTAGSGIGKGKGEQGRASP